MTQGNYIEDTQDLIRRSQQTMGDTPVLDLSNWQQPMYMSNNSQLKSLSGSCHRVEVKNTIDGTTSKCPVLVDSSIIICTSASTGDCPATVPASITCPTDNIIGTDTFVNMVAKFTMGTAQNVDVIFKYLYNDVPTQTTVLYSATLGDNTVYAFASNVQYLAGESLVLYGAEVLA